MDKEMFGRRITSKRAEKGLSRKDLADAAGIAVSTLAYYERGEKVPGLDVAMMISKALDTSLDWLCGISSSAENGTISTLGDVIHMFGILTANTKDSSITHEYGTVYLSFYSPLLSNLADSWNKFLSLYNEKQVDKEMYMAWIEKKAHEYKVRTIDGQIVEEDLPF